MQPYSLRTAFGLGLLVSALIPAALTTWLIGVKLPEAGTASASRALEVALVRDRAAIEAHLMQAHRAMDGLLPATAATSADAAQALGWISDPALFSPMASALTRASPDIRFIYYRSESGSIHGVENAMDGFRFNGRGAIDGGARSALWMPPNAPLKSVGAGGESPDPRGQAWPSAEAKSGDRTFSPVAVYPTSRQLVMTLSQPVRSQSGGLLGVLGVDLSLYAIEAMLRAQPVSPKSVAFLVDAQGSLLASSDSDERGGSPKAGNRLSTPPESENLAVRAAFDALEKKWAIAPGTKDAAQPAWSSYAGSGGPVLVTYTNVGRDMGLSWTLVTAAPEADFGLPTASLAYGFMAALLAWAAALAVLAIFTAKCLGRQLASFARSIDQVAEGKVPLMREPTRLREFNEVFARVHKTAIKLSGRKPPAHGTLPALVAAPPANEKSVLDALRHELAERTNELAIARDRAMVATRSKADFLAAISHELRTPLNGIVGMTALLANTELDDEQRDYLDSLVVSGNRLLSVVDGILDFSRSGSGEIVLQIAPFEVRAVVETVCGPAAKAAHAKGLKLVVDVPGLVRRGDGDEVPWVILGDAARFAQVVGELVTNAVKFTETGHVIVQMRPVHSATKIDLPMLEGRVIDSGPGIAAEQVADVFSAFGQLDSSSSRRHQGAGIGLSTCKKLVELMGGRLDLQSKAGKGSTFKFSVLAPWAAVKPAPAAMQNDAQLRLDFPHGHDAAQVSILVVDDNAINLKVACAMLAKFGYTVLTASSGREAIDRVARALDQGEPLGAVVMDVHMPDLDGIEATRAIRAAHGNRAPPIIALTAGSSVEDCQRCLDAGMVEYLTKPLQVSALARSLETWVKVAAPDIKKQAAQPAGQAHAQAVLHASHTSLQPPPQSPVKPAVAARAEEAGKPAVLSAVPPDTEPPRSQQKLTTQEQAQAKAKASAADTTGTKLVDFQRLADFREFDDDELSMTREVIALLFNEVPLQLAAMESAIAERDFRALARSAHSLRGAASNVGAVSVQQLCGTLEQDTLKAQAAPADVTQRLADLRAAWAQTQPLLESWH